MKRSGSMREFEYAASFDEEEEECTEESARPDKKRRLRADQVKALERCFEVENKLEPERKVQLAMDLGLDPRQVAIWFQNRRARWKNKQLERDYASLQSAFDDLKQSHDAVKLENETLIQQIGEMRARMKMRTDVVSEKDEFIGDDPFGLGVAFYRNVNVVSSDSAASGMHSEDNNNSPPNGVVSSCELFEDVRSPAIWPATYTLLADEVPAPIFNWQLLDPWT